MIEGEQEVFRLTTFDTDKCYEFALSTRKEGKYPNEKYFTTNPLQYAGKYLRSQRGRGGDGGAPAEIFDDGTVIEKKVYYDYDGKTCFREVDCRDSPESKGGKSNRRKSNRRKSNCRKSNRRKSNRRKSNRRKSNHSR
jgi:hypothetical protein